MIMVRVFFYEYLKKTYTATQKQYRVNEDVRETIAQPQTQQMARAGPLDGALPVVGTRNAGPNGVPTTDSRGP